jgi:acyl carrier protein
LEDRRLLSFTVSSSQATGRSSFVPFAIASSSSHVPTAVSLRGRGAADLATLRAPETSVAFGHHDAVNMTGAQRVVHSASPTGTVKSSVDAKTASRPPGPAPLFHGKAGVRGAGSNVASPAVAVAKTSTMLHASASGRVASGTSVTFTATVKAEGSAIPPTGHIQFYGEDKTLLHGLALNSHGSVSVDLNFLPGTHTIRAVYRGGPGFAPSEGVPITLVVADAGPAPHRSPTVNDRVIDLVSERLGVPRDHVTLGSSFIDDLGADSLDLVELVMAIEEEFHITVPDHEAEQIKTVGHAIHLIKSRIGSSR